MGAAAAPLGAPRLRGGPPGLRGEARPGLEPGSQRTQPGWAVNFGFSKEEEDFRSEVRAFLEPWRDLDGFFGQGRKWDRVAKLFREMGERGWLALAWPESAGGLGRGPAAEFILWDEVAHARAARNPLSAGIVARSLVRYGTEAQRARWLPPIRSGAIHFSLAYS
ncbi:MAG TPA: acyl-CoA dehydrogenase family protein, partial [Alphaproteobacteria bacterium]|nr:acyl-CoA dehydrogenase family protein [Alphaproteobacteria bacterium]